MQEKEKSVVRYCAMADRAKPLDIFYLLIPVI